MCFAVSLLCVVGSAFALGFLVGRLTRPPLP